LVGVLILDQTSELVFEGDLGQSSAGRLSERYALGFTDEDGLIAWGSFGALRWRYRRAGSDRRRCPQVAAIQYSQCPILNAQLGYRSAPHWRVIVRRQKMGQTTLFGECLKGRRACRIDSVDRLP
jgi:hypothetical protein